MGSPPRTTVLATCCPSPPSSDSGETSMRRWAQKQGEHCRAKPCDRLEDTLQSLEMILLSYFRDCSHSTNLWHKAVFGQYALGAC
eukprot:6181442-Pleurochrysis_carterae.AAC.1